MENYKKSRIQPALAPSRPAPSTTDPAPAPSKSPAPLPLDTEQPLASPAHVLMHTCCAPCSVYCIDSLRAEGIEPTIFWFNPNIHPYMEYKARRDCLKDYVQKVHAHAIFIENYGLDDFCKNVVGDIPNRCVNYCYRARIGATVRYAAEHGYDAFTTTLLVSPYQRHEELKQVCEELAALSGIKFIYRDFRVGFRAGQAKAREFGLYMQKYCGCIFSEEDRYKKQIERDLAAGVIEL